ncbi:hypothetical protein CMUS01_04869 [Colletotrichum musicola]|uniref:Uncharacterized protein n=1 Tax=Colletotrichum musicola TaxID=2175873 RepID=A0A8H6KUD2_9PEZI|nr:hypothetical protein CMUS01_04869 [Colletotrichum musicola]
MLFSTVTLGLVASQFWASALAAPAHDPTVEATSGGHGYLVPIDKDPKDYDINADWMVPVDNYINRDTNETIFDDDGFDIVARRALDDPAEALAILQARDKYGYKMWFSRNDADMGCDIGHGTIAWMLGEAVYALCKNGWCDNGAGVKWVTPVKHMNGGGPISQKYLEITAKGLYTGPHTLGNMHNLMKASSTKQTVKFAERRNYMNSQWGAGILKNRCQMAKYPNYIRVEKPSPNMISLEIRIKLQDVDNTCMATEVVEILAGALNGAVGAFFGLVNLFCG